MAKLKLGALVDDKPVRLTVELRPLSTAISSPMPKRWAAKPASP